MQTNTLIWNIYIGILLIVTMVYAVMTWPIVVVALPLLIPGYLGLLMAYKFYSDPNISSA